MAKKQDKVDTFNPRDVRRRHLETPHYSDADIEIIIEAIICNRPKRLHWKTRRKFVGKLEHATTEYFVARAWQRKPTPLQLQERMKSISHAAERLIQTLGLGTKSHTNPDLVPYAVLRRFRIRATPAPSPEEHVRITIEAIHRLYRWAYQESSAQRTTHGSRPRHERHEADTALNGLLLAYATIWREFTGKEPKTPYIHHDTSSEKAGQPDGPFFRFCIACLSPLNVEIPPHGLRDRIAKLLRTVGNQNLKIPNPPG